MEELIQLTVQNGTVNAKFSDYLNKTISAREFPLKFRVEDWTNGDVIWETEVYSGWFASYPNVHNRNVSVYTRSGKLLKRHIFDPFRNSSHIDQFFHAWVTSHSRTEGLVLGAGTGTWGEWLLSVMNNDCRAVLVEGNPDSLPSLKANHGNRSNVTIVPFPVTSSGDKVTFWKAGSVSSIHKEVSEKLMYPGFEPEAIVLESVSINQVLQDNFPNGIDWIRVDIEGADHEIIMSIPEHYFQQMSLVVFETLNMGPVEMAEIIEKMKRCGFNEFMNIEIDTICTKVKE